MKRALRFLRDAAIAGSALVCVAAVADRVWDHWAGHYVEGTTDWRIGEWTVVGGPDIRSNQGVLFVGFQRYKFDDETAKASFRNGYGYGNVSPDHHWMQTVNTFPGIDGLAISTISATYRRNSSYKVWLFEAPHWFIATLATIAPACWLTGHLRRRRDRDAGRCRRCGYDLRATPDRCPECGEPRGDA